MIAIPHRSASGSLDNGWEFDPHERRVLCNVRVGATSVEFGLWVCSPERLVLGAHPFSRVNEECWKVLPERVIRTWSKGRESLETVRSPVHGALGCVGLMLTNTPAYVSQLLELL